VTKNHAASDIRRQATRLLDAASITHEPVSLRDVVSALNLELLGKTREPFTSESALHDLAQAHAAAPNGTGDSGRKRFTIAHEIGHFVLHQEGFRREAGGVAGRAEDREADAFAAELLMPEHLVRQAVLEHGPDDARLADRFEVGRKAMRARLRQLGLAERHSEH
jgi:Zn-dependent peptidase ImmA (M78 family)